MYSLYDLGGQSNPIRFLKIQLVSIEKLKDEKAGEPMDFVRNAI